MTVGIKAAIRSVLGLVLASALAACTTVEGTNALTDFGTFEREVMTSTAQGFGLVPQGEAKEDPNVRAPLALPRNLSSLPPPSQNAAAQLPANNDNPQIDTAGLSQADLQRLRNARVVDLNTYSGRPLTEAEARALTARMSAAGMNVSSSNQRPLYLPPERYFTVVGGRDMVCQAPNGELVPLNDARCPEQIRRALRSAGPHVPGPGGFSASDQMGQN
ncbi:hypothetical protein VE25_07160 [Devosia geojensis]|uniref:Lipoprotein n=1 Tax=Devosia geojensis TaxID=443610 RepID=A0A0F5FUC9_9HYPH|nr:hypothetical protein [Devosia geojensis]KKB12476.1 hypothetical protein VE25_07160 [Devosia geojensis]